MSENACFLKEDININMFKKSKKKKKEINMENSKYTFEMWPTTSERILL